MAHAQAFKLALLQFAIGLDPAENLRKAQASAEAAIKSGAQVLCLPELFRTPYFCQREDAPLFDLAETIPGPTTEAFSEICRQHNVAAIVPVFERRAPGLYHNSAAVIDAGGALLGVYRKMHIPDDPGYYEKYYFTPGDLGFRVFETRFGKVGVLICWDQWFPEAARLAALQGATVLCYPTAIGWNPKDRRSMAALEQLDAWRTIQRAHAIANGVYVAAVNRFGLESPLAGGLARLHQLGTPAPAQPANPEEGLLFWGSSFIADPFGAILEEGPDDAPVNLLAVIDPRRMEEVRRNWPFLRDRRIDAYAGLNERYRD